MWVINIQHWLDEDFTGPGLPQLKFKVEKLCQIITYATSHEVGISMDSKPICWRRPKRRPCVGELQIEVCLEDGQIHWMCPVCGDEGVVSGWEGLIWDMTDFRKDAYH